MEITKAKSVFCNGVNMKEYYVDIKERFVYVGLMVYTRCSSYVSY
jgi:hypothetical protein